MEEDISLMKAVHKYKNTLTPENKRRIGQSLGYKHSLADQPLMVALLERAGIITNKPEKLLHDADTISL
jgi:hypothetical protein